MGCDESKRKTNLVDMIRNNLRNAISEGEIALLNISAFIFWVTGIPIATVTNFHICSALRDAIWEQHELSEAREEFLGEVRKRLDTRSDLAT